MSCGAPAVVTEMVASEALVKETTEFVLRAEPHGGGGPFIVQLAGRDPVWFAEAARRLSAAGVDIIDINMGCPAKRVTGGQGGCALMREPDLARRIIASVVKATDRPVTVKMRLGWDERSLNAAEVARIAEGEGAQALTVHGRTRTQFYEGRADWSAVATVVGAVSLPVIVNGDIADPTSAEGAMRSSGAVGVMIGRGALGRPWRCGEIAAALFGAPYAAPSLETKVAIMLEQVRASCRLYGERQGVRIVRKHVAAFVEGLEADHDEMAGVASERVALCRIEGEEELHDTIGRLIGDRRLAA
jgi:nifR3 family TIM-barrel protein